MCVDVSNAHMKVITCSTFSFHQRMNKRLTNDEATSQAAVKTVMRRRPLAEETNTVWADKDGERLIV